MDSTTTASARPWIDSPVFGAEAQRLLGQARALAGVIAAAVCGWLAVSWSSESMWMVASLSAVVGIDGIRQALERASPLTSLVIDSTAVAMVVIYGQFPGEVLIPSAVYVALVTLFVVPVGRRAVAGAYAATVFGLAFWVAGGGSVWSENQLRVIVAAAAALFPAATLFLAIRLSGVLRRAEAAEAQRRRTESRLAVAVDSGRAIILVASTDGVIRSAEGGGLEGLGISGASLQGLHIKDLGITPSVLDSSRARRWEHWGRIWECRAIRTDDELTLVGLDVTEVIEAQRSLEQREHWFRSLIDHGHDVVAVLNSDGVLTFVGGSVRQLLGYDPHEMIGHHAGEFLHPEDAATSAEPFQAMDREGRRHGVCEWRVRHADGSYRVLQAAITDRRDDPVVGGWVLNERDVTDRRRHEREIQERNRELAALNRITEAALSSTNLTTGLEAVMGEISGLTGFSTVFMEQLTDDTEHVEVIASWGDEVNELLHLDDTVWSKRVLETQVTAVDVLECESPQSCSHSYGMHTVVAAPLVVDTESIGIIFLADRQPLDIPPRLLALIGRLTDHLALLVFRRRAVARLERLLESKDEFVAAVSHELRTPLTSVVGLSQEMRDNLSAFSPQEISEFAGLISDQAADVAYLVEDLLVAARAETGALSVTMKPVDLTNQVTKVLERESLRCPYVELDTHVQPAAAIGDPPRVRQILRNLITNAYRYGGSAVTVATGTDGEFAYLRVSDDGPGVPASEAEAIFEPYYRSTRGQAPGSVGLGLTVARQLARLMGGDLVYRRTGGWSVFELTLRARQP